MQQDLNKKSEDDEVKADLTSGCEAAERVLSKANEAVNRDLLDEAVEALTNRVAAWTSHKVEHFGKLILHGVYGVITGKTDQEKDVSWLLRTIRPLLTPPSTKFTCSSLSFCAARKSHQARARIRRTSYVQQAPRFETRTPSFN